MTLPTDNGLPLTPSYGQLKAPIEGIAPSRFCIQIGELVTSKSGLGLVLCQRIIALHGGRLWAQRGGVDRVKGTPTSKDGMTFKVTLPMMSSEKRPQ